MQRELEAVVAEILRSAARGRKLAIGVLYLGNPGVVRKIAADGHRVAVTGDRFPLLYRLYVRFKGAPSSGPLIIEARFDALPIRPGSLDALVATNGLPAGLPPLDTLRMLRGLLKESGLLVWPHPIADGTGGKAGRLAALFRRGAMHPIPRERISALVMESGFREVGQYPLPGLWLPWVVTTGRAGRRPWEAPPSD